MNDWKSTSSKEQKDRLIREKWGGESPHYLWFAVLSSTANELRGSELRFLADLFFGGQAPDPGAIELSVYTDGPTKDGVHADLRIRGFTSEVVYALTMRGQEMPLMRVADDTNTQPIHFRPAG